MIGTSTPLTASQQDWQNKYATFKTQQDASLAQVNYLNNLSRFPAGLTQQQTDLLNIFKIKQIDAETQLIELRSNIRNEITLRIGDVTKGMERLTYPSADYDLAAEHASNLHKLYAELKGPGSIYSDSISHASQTSHSSE